SEPGSNAQAQRHTAGSLERAHARCRRSVRAPRLRTAKRTETLQPPLESQGSEREARMSE
ncbi:hypothetical protein scyTo_0021308, partial [Scyliorhinus torazame]|nr:hypothetical protein [Scyliorhinus torazame]